MATIVAATGAAGNWTSGSAWAGGVAPTAADDAQITSLTTSLTINSGAVCRSADFLGCTGTVTHTAGVTLTIGDGTAGLSNIALRLASGMTYTLGNPGTCVVSFVSSSTTQQTVTTAGKTLGGVTLNHANLKLQMQDALTMSGSFTRTAANTWDMNGNAMTLNGAARTFAGNGATYTSLVNLTGSGAYIISGANTFSGGLNRTGTAVKTDALSIAANQIVSGGNLTLAGNSAINRLLVRSSSLSASRTITNSGSTAVWSYVDLRDIALGTAYDANAITGKSGDCGGNSGITFTTSATQTATGTASFAWSTHGWTSRVPLPQDDVVINNAFVAGRTVTMDMPRMGRSIDFTGLSGSPSVSSSTGIQLDVYGSLTLVAGMTWTNSQEIWFLGHGSYTLTSAGKTLTTNGSGATITLGSSGTLALQDALVVTNSLNIDRGTFTTNGYSVSTSLCAWGAMSAVIANLGASTITLTGTGTVWSMGAANTTMNAGTSTIHITDTSSSSKTFGGGGKTYNNLKWTTGGSGTIIIASSNTFAAWQHTGGTTKTVTVTGGTTQTLTGGASALQGGAASNLITCKSVTNSSAWTLSSATRLQTDYIVLQDCTGAGAGISHNAGANSTNVSGNTNWTFTSAPSRSFSFSY
jgi:hypothetical protein